MLLNAQVLREYEAGRPAPLDCMTGADEWSPEHFRDVFQRFCRPIMSFLLCILGNRAVAEELTQETFVRAFRKISVKPEKVPLSTWLFGIARNVAREAIKEKYRIRRLETADRSEALDVPHTGGQPDERLISEELNAAIQRALVSLPEDYRTVFVLKIINQLRYEEISAVTGFSPGKLKTDLHRARSEMRKRLLPYLGKRDAGEGGVA